MPIRLALTLLLATAFVGASWSQTTLSARVVNQALKPVPGCSVLVYPKGPSALTDAQGRFNLFLPANSIQKPAPNRLGPVVVGSRYFDYLGRWLDGRGQRNDTRFALRKDAAATIPLRFSARGYPLKSLTLYDREDLDSLVILDGLGISITSPLYLRPGRVGEILKVSADHALPDRPMKIEFQLGVSGPWFTLAAPACLASIAPADTCELPLTYRFLVPNPDDTLPYDGMLLRVKMTDAADTSIWSQSEAFRIYPKPPPEIIVSRDTTVSILDTIFLRGRAEDNQFNEALAYSWRIGGRTYPYAGGDFPMTAPAKGDSTMEAEFRVKRPDETSYGKTVKIRVVWDYPIVTPQKDTAVAIHMPAILRVKSTNAYGANKKFEWDFGNTGTWVATTVDSVLFPGSPTINTVFPVSVRVTDDDNLSTTAAFKLNLTVPHFQFTDGGFISDVLPRPDKTTLFVGADQYKILFGSADSVGRIQWSKSTSWMHPSHAADYATNKMLLNNHGDITILTRYGTSSGGDGSIRLRRTSLTGDSLWEKSFKTSSSYADGRQLMQLPGNDYLIPYEDSFQGWVARTDADGMLKWKRGYPVFQDLSKAVPIANGNVVLCGMASKKSASNDYLSAMAEITPTGDTVWTRTYEYPQNEFTAVFPVSGGYRVFGYTFGGGPSAIFSMLTNSTGLPIDTVMVGTTGGMIIPVDAVEAPDGGFMLLCIQEAPSGSANSGIVFMKFSAAGAFQWKKVYNMPGIGSVAALRATPDGGYVAGGRGNFTGDFRRSAGTLLVVDGNAELR